MSNKVERVTSTLELDERIDLQVKAWQAQRVGWVFIFLIVLTAALGFYGEGWISKKEMKSGPVSIEYERFFRHEARMELRLSLSETAGSTIVSLPMQYLKKVRIESIIPEPKENFIQNGRVQYVF